MGLRDLEPVNSSLARTPWTYRKGQELPEGSGPKPPALHTSRSPLHPSPVRHSLPPHPKHSQPDSRSNPQSPGSKLALGTHCSRFSAGSQSLLPGGCPWSQKHLGTLTFTVPAGGEGPHSQGAPSRQGLQLVGCVEPGSCSLLRRCVGTAAGPAVKGKTARMKKRPQPARPRGSLLSIPTRTLREAQPSIPPSLPSPGLLPSQVPAGWAAGEQ